MATTKSQPTVESRVVLSCVSWKTYEALLKDHENSSAPRFTYDRGTLEIMSPLPDHEVDNRCLETVIDAAAEAHGFDLVMLGSTTFQREDLVRGFEADSCYYLANADIARGRKSFDLRTDPPPDLVVEIETSRSAVDKLVLYAAFGVPEVWRYDGRALTMLVLKGDAYGPSPTSRAMPRATSEAVGRLVRVGGTTPRRAWLATVREWASGLGAGEVEP